MTAGQVPPLPAGCPWADWAPPNLKWCEDNVCGWITTPANTWSNVAYFVAAWLIWREARHAKAAELRWFAPAALALGLGSFAYHASYTFAFQVLDFVGMYLVIFLFIVMNLRRAGVATPGTAPRYYAAGVLALTGAMLAMARYGLPYQLTVLVLAGVILVQELRLPRPAAAAAYADLRLAWGFFAAALACSMLDLTRVLCDPSNHWLQGHAVWHVLSALGIHRGFRFYSALDRAGEV